MYNVEYCYSYMVYELTVVYHNGIIIVTCVQYCYSYTVYELTVVYHNGKYVFGQWWPALYSRSRGSSWNPGPFEWLLSSI